MSMRHSKCIKPMPRTVLCHEQCSLPPLSPLAPHDNWFQCQDWRRGGGAEGENKKEKEEAEKKETEGRERPDGKFSVFVLMTWGEKKRGWNDGSMRNVTLIGRTQGVEESLR